MANVKMYRPDATGRTKSEALSLYNMVQRAPLKLQNPSCAGHDPDKWHPSSSRVQFRIEIEKHSEVLDLCYACPDRVACLQYALDNHEDSGIWGGLLETERRGWDGQSAEWLIAADERKRASVLR